MKTRTIVAGGLVAAVVVAGAAAATVNRPRSTSYATTTSVIGSVTQTFASSGVVTRPGQQQLGFDTPGTVSSLSVKVGDAVAKGQVIAELDPAPLQVALLQAQAQVAQAQAVKDADQVAYDNGTASSAVPTSTQTGSQPTTASGGTGAGGTGAGGTGVTGGTGGTTTPSYLVALQGSMAKLSAVAQAQQAACAPVYALVNTLQDLQSKLPTTVPTALPTTFPTPTWTPSPPAPSASPTPSTTAESPAASPSPSAVLTPAPTTATPSPTTTTPAPTASGMTAKPTSVPTIPIDQATKLAAQLEACTASMVALATVEQEAGQAIVAASAGMQAATTAAQQQLAAAQAQMTAAAQAAAQQAAAQAMAQAQAQLAAQAQRALGSKVTEGTLAVDRARVLQAQQAVDRAQRAIDGARLTSPADGVVGAVSLAAGESSAGRTLTVVGPGAAEIAVEVPLSFRGLVASGMAASVGLVGADATLRGQVTSVSVLPTSTVGTPTYTARIGVDDPSMVLYAGARALVDLPLRTATDVVVVPASAVTKTSDTTGTVQVVSDPYATSADLVQVTTGASGGGRIEIVSGLAVGRLVVLADRRLPVPGGLQQYQPATQTPTPTPTR